MSAPQQVFSTTPLYRQYRRIKDEYTDAVLLFRLGDFYETFEEDARIAARDLEIVLTSREMGKGRRMPMAGIPSHALENYLSRLVRQGHKVAICEQLTEPGRGLVERGVVRVVTPGTVIEPGLLEQKTNNYLVAIIADGDQAGLAYADISTSVFATTQIPKTHIMAELERLNPAEILISRHQSFDLPLFGTVTQMDEQAFSVQKGRESLLRHFGVATLEGYGNAHLPLAIAAAGAVLDYVIRTNKESVKHLTDLYTYDVNSYMALDPQTRRNLELFQGGRWGKTENSLVNVLDLTKTPMGGRLLKSWIGQPLRDLDDLTDRLDIVSAFFEDTSLRRNIRDILGSLGDLERLANRIIAGSPLPREIISLRHSLELLPGLKNLLMSPNIDHRLRKLGESIQVCEDLAFLISNALVEEPHALAGEGGVIREGFSLELDEIRAKAREARGFIAGLELKERERTGIRSLKVGYTKVFGYYLEVSHANLSGVPENYIRRQTLINHERFITPELKDQESLILNAADRIAELEVTLFRQVCHDIAAGIAPLIQTALAVAQKDVLCSFAEIAYKYGYTRPKIDNGKAIRIVEGRHPVVERSLPVGSFISNDTYLSNDDNQVNIITGPNMSGKSTYIRQTALIVLMTQIGSFVPAKEAEIGLVDRIFTRVGLQDDLSTGQSTFMVEMVETANILNQATSRSLVILDEIGRGTSTYDGMAIAQAVAEHLHDHPRLGCKTLFATHYHELTDLSRRLTRVRNSHVTVVEQEGRVVFLHRIAPGSTDRSYGVHVAQLAGMPSQLISRAWELLDELEKNKGVHLVEYQSQKNTHTSNQQLTLGNFTLEEFRRELIGLDTDNLSPIDALNFIHDFQKRARDIGL